MTSPEASAERLLIAALAVGIARRLNVLRATFHGYQLEGYVNPGVTSRFIAGCDILWRLGVALGAVDPDRKDLTPQTVGSTGPHPYFYKFMPLDDIARMLLAKPRDPSVAIDDVVAAYMGLVEFDARRIPFVPDPEWDETLQFIDRKREDWERRRET